jgi:peptidoglycan/LPS O-acetylase OafA/YrhL
MFPADTQFPHLTETPLVIVPPAPTSPELIPVRSPAGQGSEGDLGQSTSQLPPKPQNARYESLDLWRGAACLMLVFYHCTFYGKYEFRISDPSTWTWSGLPLYLIRFLWVGVPIFFVISGYCIAASVDSLRRRDHSTKDYFIRRFRRIYPPLWIMCALAVLFTMAINFLPSIANQCQQLPRLSELSPTQWFGNILAAESWRHNVFGGKPSYLMANTWTLCYEEQFYFVTGLILAFAGRRFFSVTAWLTAIVLVGRGALQLAGIRCEGFFCDGHWLMFAAGIMVYHSLNYSQRPQSWLTIGVFGLGMVYGAIERVLANNAFDKHLGEYVFVASAFAMALILLKRFDASIAQNRLFAPLRWCGQRSYSIYLTHFLIVTLVSSVLASWGLTSELIVATCVIPLCLIASLPIASLFYVAVERHFMNAPLDKSAARAKQGRAG